MATTGGDSLTSDLNTPYDRGDMVWVGVAACMVWLMCPGIAMFYAGLARKRHAVTLVWEGFAVYSVVFFQWFFWGYSFVFSHDAGVFWGNLNNFALMKTLGEPSVGSTNVPDILFCLYQGMFACVTAVILVGGAHERARLGPLLVFVFIEITLVYCPAAEWTWNGNGWLADLGSLDYAGGGPVHMASGMAALVYALICGKRHDPAALDKMPKYKPGSMLLVAVGSLLTIFGWFGFNGGSTGNASMRSWYAIVNTHLSCSTGALTWLFVDYIKTRKWSMAGMCSGAIAGLVGITPGAGFVPVYTAVVFGVVTSFCSNMSGYLKILIRIDDGLDVFAIHGVGGAVGSILTGLFAADYISHLDGELIAQGWMNHHYVQLPYQLAGIGAIWGWSFVVTALVLLIMNFIPFLKLRMSEEDELLGSDVAQLEESGMLYEIKTNPGNNRDLFATGTVNNYEGVDATNGYEDAYQYKKKDAESADSPPTPPPQEEVSPVNSQTHPVA